MKSYHKTTNLASPTAISFQGSSLSKQPSRFVSRAGEKLAAALMKFKIDVTDKVCADFGCSTGGFSDCLLQNKAKKVYSIDTAYGILDWKLRNDPRIIVKERTNAMHVELPEKMDFISVDTSWTKQNLIIKHALTQLKANGIIISLLKPQYEAPKEFLIKGKVNPVLVEQIKDTVQAQLQSENINIQETIESPILGEKGGNKEFLMLIKN